MMLKRLAGMMMTLCVPVLLVMGGVRLLMTPLALQLEYTRPGFPADVYGFTTQDRLMYGPVAIEYMLTDADISLLRGLRIGATGAFYTERELDHMVDVKKVTQAAFSVLMIGLGIFSAALVILRRDGKMLRGALMQGALLTLGAIVALVFAAVVAWDFFFTLFHQLFFSEGTWIFLYSDTLIRLYPEQFWFDAALTLGVIVVGGALVLFAGTVWLGRGVARRVEAL